MQNRYQDLLPAHNQHEDDGEGTKRKLGGFPKALRSRTGTAQGMLPQPPPYLPRIYTTLRWFQIPFLISTLKQPLILTNSVRFTKDTTINRIHNGYWFTVQGRLHIVKPALAAWIGQDDTRMPSHTRIGARVPHRPIAPKQPWKTIFKVFQEKA